MFAIVFQCKEARAFDNAVMTKAGERCLVMEEPDGWVEATSQRYDDEQSLPVHTKLFKTREACASFMRRWKGHPWYAEPNGVYEVLEVAPRYVQHLAGYEVVR